MDSRPANMSRVTMTQIVLPNNTNSLGTAFGGTIMSWIDIAAAVSAQRHARSVVVTASVDDLHFLAPVYKGWVVNLVANVNFTSRTSMEVGVRVDAENPSTGECFHTASAYLTFVALDSHGKPKAIPPVLAESDEEKRWFAEGEQRRKLRLERRELFKK